MTEAQTLADLGEFHLIDLLTRHTHHGDEVIVGPGDDGAVLRLGPDLVTSTDVLIEDVHFRRTWSQPIDIGRKAVAVNVADMEAMGARTVGLLLGLAAPVTTPVTWLRFLAQGLTEECQTVGASLVGGDVVSAPQVSLSVTVFGVPGESGPVLRSGARPGDEVALCGGPLGLAAAGLQVLRQGFRSPRAAVSAQRVPAVPYGAGQRAAEAGATAMIDVSDGLLADVGHIARASGAHIDIARDAIPVPDEVHAVARAHGAEPLAFVLTGGEDHALVATFPPGAAPDGWSVIGSVRDGSHPQVTVDGEPWAGAKGWQHFR